MLKAFGARQIDLSCGSGKRRTKIKVTGESSFSCLQFKIKAWFGDSKRCLHPKAIRKMRARRWRRKTNDHNVRRPGRSYWQVWQIRY